MPFGTEYTPYYRLPMKCASKSHFKQKSSVGFTDPPRSQKSSLFHSYYSVSERQAILSLLSQRIESSRRNCLTWLMICWVSPKLSQVRGFLLMISSSLIPSLCLVKPVQPQLKSLDERNQIVSRGLNFLGKRAIWPSFFSSFNSSSLYSPLSSFICSLYPFKTTIPITNHASSQEGNEGQAEAGRYHHRACSSLAGQKVKTSPTSPEDRPHMTLASDSIEKTIKNISWPGSPPRLPRGPSSSAQRVKLKEKDEVTKPVKQEQDLEQQQQKRKSPLPPPRLFSATAQDGPSVAAGAAPTPAASASAPALSPAAAATQNSTRQKKEKRDAT